MARSVIAPLSPTEDPFTQAILKAILLRFSVLSDSIKAMKTPAAFAFTFIFPRRKSQADQKTTHINTPHQWLKTYRFPCAVFFFSPEKRSNNFWPGSQSINAFSTSSAVQKNVYQCATWLSREQDFSIIAENAWTSLTINYQRSDKFECE